MSQYKVKLKSNNLCLFLLCFVEASVEANCFRGGFTLKASRLGGAVLRPPVLGDSSIISSALSNTNSNNSSTTLAGGNEKTDEDGIVGNPFLREQREDEDEAGAQVVESTENIDKDDDEIDERPDPLSMLRNNGIERSNIFAAAKTTLPRVQTSGFIFGQNVHERVVGV